jgi:hypothetical protein
MRAPVAVVLTLLLAAPEAPVLAQGRGSRSRGSVNSVNRSAPGTGGSWSGPRTSGSTSRTYTGSSSSRTTTAQTRSGQSATGIRNVSKSGDEVTVDRNVQTSTGASKSSQKTYEMDDGRVESVERDTRPYNYYGHAYYGHAGVYYRPYAYRGAYYYHYMPPPWGCYYTTVPVGAIALTVAGMALLYSDGTYYKTTYVEGATQYQVVAPPAGAALPAGTSLPADRASITIAGVTYYLYGNTFYKHVLTNGQESFVVITRPGGVVTVKALPEDFEPMQAGSMMYFRSKARYYLTYLDPSGEELYVVVDPPAGAVPAIPAAAEAGQPPAAAPPPAPAPKPQTVTLTAPANSPMTVRVATEVSSATAQAGQRFQGNLDADLLAADGRVIATRGTRVYGRVVAAKAGTGTGGAPQLSLELTDVEAGRRVVSISTAPVSYTAEAKKAGKKVLGGAALGAGIGGMIDGGEGAAWGAAAGAVVGVAAAKSSPGNQVAVAAGTAVEFRLAVPLSVSIVL